MKKVIKILIGLFLVVTVLLTSVWFSGKDNDLEVYFFNIGQGDGVLIRTPSYQNIIIDGDITAKSKIHTT